MQYKTIALELIQENSALYEKLRAGKMLLTAMDAYAIDLKAAHEKWKERLSVEPTRAATRGRSRPKRWSWRFRRSRTVYPPHRQHTKRNPCRSTRR